MNPRIAPHDEYDHLREDAEAVAHLAAVMHDLDANADRRRFESDYTMTADALGPISGDDPAELRALWRERPALVSVWTDRDTSEAGPTVDDAPARVNIEQGDGGTPVLHIVTSDGPRGLWTIALALTPESAAALARDLDASR